MNPLRDAYRRLIRQAPLSDPHPYEPEDIVDMGEDDEPTGLLPEGVTLLIGPSGAGKSSFATALALAVAAGEPFAGRPAESPQPVAWFAAEENFYERGRLLAHRYRDREPEDHPLPITTHYGAIALDDPDNLRTFLNRLQTTVGGMAVLDPLPAFLRNPAAARDIILTLREIGINEGISFLATHWTGPSGPMGGPSVASSARAIWHLSSTPHGEGRLVDLFLSGRAHGNPKTLRFRSRHPLHYELMDAPHSEGKPAKATAEARVAAALTQTPASAEELAHALDLSPNTVRNALTGLVAAGLATPSKRGRTTKYTSPPPP